MKRKTVFVKDVSVELGRLLRARRSELRLTLDAVAMASRIPYSAIIDAEHGRTDLSFARLRALCVALGLEIVFQPCEPQSRDGEWLRTWSIPANADLRFD